MSQTRLPHNLPEQLVMSLMPALPVARQHVSRGYVDKRLGNERNFVAIRQPEPHINIAINLNLASNRPISK